MDQKNLQDCIGQCLDCTVICEECASGCIGDAQMQTCLRLCLECAEICQACARVVARQSSLTVRWRGFCAEVCDACAAECEKYSDNLMRRCAQACRQCATVCREIAAAA